MKAEKKNDEDHNENHTAGVTEKVSKVKISDGAKKEDGQGNRPTLRAKKSFKRKKMSDDEVYAKLSKYHGNLLWGI